MPTTILRLVESILYLDLLFPVVHIVLYCYDVRKEYKRSVCIVILYTVYMCVLYDLWKKIQRKQLLLGYITLDLLHNVVHYLMDHFKLGANGI